MNFGTLLRTTALHSRYIFEPLTPELRPRMGNNLLVFALPSSLLKTRHPDGPVLPLR